MSSVSINYSPRPWQAEQHYHAKGKRDLNLIVCRQSGKTEFACAESLSRILSGPPNCDYGVVSPFLSQTKRIWAPRLEKLLSGLMRAGIARYRVTDGYFDLPNNCKLYLLGADNDAARGLALRGLILDELDGMSPDMLDGVIFPTQNNYPDSWRLAIGTLGEGGILYKRHAQHTDDDSWHCAILDAYEAGINPEVIERMRATVPPHIFAREMMCDPYAAVPSGVFSDITLQVTERQLELRRPVIASFDLGISDATAMWLFQFDHTGKRLNAAGFREFSDQGFDNICRTLLRDYKLPWSTSTIVLPHDGATRSIQGGTTTVQDIAYAILDPKYCEVIPAESKFTQLQAARLLAAQMSFGPDAEKGVECLKQVRFATDKFGNPLDKVVHDKFSHGYDAFRTGCWWMLKDGLSVDELLPPEPLGTVTELDPASVESTAAFFDSLENPAAEQRTIRGAVAPPRRATVLKGRQRMGKVKRAMR